MAKATNRMSDLRNNHTVVSFYLFLLLGLLGRSDGFASTLLTPTRTRLAHCAVGPSSINPFKGQGTVTASVAFHQSVLLSRPSALFMSREGENSGFLAAIGGTFIILLFVATSFFPFLGGKDTPMGLADAVVTRQDAPNGKFSNFESETYRLSRGAIQEKLNSLPVFYLINEDGSMKTTLFLAYDDARAAAGSGTIKATTMDQVTYPLVLQRGRMRMAPPPFEVQQAEDTLTREGTVAGSKQKYKFVPSQQALQDAADMNMELLESDIPLFVAERLAFQSSKGPQIPLFVEKADAITSYNRLREASGASTKLPEQPTIRSTTLFDELNSMEKGTRPGVSQLAFYGNTNDLMRAGALMQ